MERFREALECYEKALRTRKRGTAEAARRRRARDSGAAAAPTKEMTSVRRAAGNPPTASRARR